MPVPVQPKPDNDRTLWNTVCTSSRPRWRQHFCM